MVCQPLSYGTYRLVIGIGAQPSFSENSCELLRNSLYIRERDADTGTAFVCRAFGFVGRT